MLSDNSPFSDVPFAPERAKGWEVGARGTIKGVLDGGETWKPHENGIEARLNAVSSSADGYHIVGVSKDGAIGSIDGGSHWKALPLRCDEGLRAVELFPTGDAVWIGGETGTHLTSNDSGATWGVLSSVDGVDAPPDGIVLHQRKASQNERASTFEDKRHR